VQIDLFPGIDQVGAILESLGFPVLSGHAHPFQKIAPVIFYSRGTSCIYHAQSRGHFLFIFPMDYIPDAAKNGKGKSGSVGVEKTENII
jgi:hypothetical protein